MQSSKAPRCFAAAAALALCAAVFFAACSHYRLGSGATLPFRTLFIAPVENAAGIPQAAIFSSQLREAFIRDARVSLVSSPAGADAVLTVSLESYTRNMTTALPRDSGLARKFDITVAAVCTLRDNRSGGVYFEKRPVTATRQIFTTPSPDSRQSDQLQAEYNTMPLLAASLAENTARAVLDVW